jgi:hypothetical protein
MFRIIPLLGLLTFTLPLLAQDAPRDVITSFFEAMSTGDTASLRHTLHPEAVLQSSVMDQVSTSSVDDLVRGVAAMPRGSLDERIYNEASLVDGSLASVTMDYVLYVNGSFSHCGVNAFTLSKSGEEWRIIHIADSRHPAPCAPNTADSISQILDEWHLAAATADADAYFGRMADDAVYVGTDATEVWSKAEFYSFARPYFDRGKAWSFRADDRNVYLQGGDMAYFDELLSTWMGPCRGSGVLIYTGGEWLIKHYVLSMTIPNDDVDAVIKLLQGE